MDIPGFGSFFLNLRCLWAWLRVELACYLNKHRCPLAHTAFWTPLWRWCHQKCKVSPLCGDSWAARDRLTGWLAGWPQVQCRLTDWLWLFSGATCWHGITKAQTSKKIHRKMLSYQWLICMILCTLRKQIGLHISNCCFVVNYCRMFAAFSLLY